MRPVGTRAVKFSQHWQAEDVAGADPQRWDDDESEGEQQPEAPSIWA